MLDAHAPQVVPTAVALQWLPPTSTVARLHEQLCNNSASHATTETNGQRKARRYHPRSRKGLQRSERMPSRRLQSCPARVGSHDGCWFPRMVVLVQHRMMRCGAACAPAAGHHTTCTCNADADTGKHSHNAAAHPTHNADSMKPYPAQERISIRGAPAVLQRATVAVADQVSELAGTKLCANSVRRLLGSAKIRADNKTSRNSGPCPCDHWMTKQPIVVARTGRIH